MDQVRKEAALSLEVLVSLLNRRNDMWIGTVFCSTDS
jgi:hypothetical protein